MHFIFTHSVGLFLSMVEYLFDRYVRVSPQVAYMYIYEKKNETNYDSMKMYKIYPVYV